MQLVKSPGRVIKLFITGEDPRSLRTVELDNWWGMAVMGTPVYFKKALEREELGRSCVYLLVQTATADDIPEVYVGESDDFSQRYQTNKFPINYDTFIVFTNKDENLTRAHVKWLELRVYDLLSESEGKVTVANKSKPSGSKLPEAETASMMTFLSNMIYILEALGFEFFDTSEPAQSAIATPIGSTAVSQPVVGSFFTTALPHNDEAKAYLDATDSGFVLRRGSMINKVTTDTLPANVRKLRDQLIQDGELVEDGGNALRLQKDITFAKTSPASALVKGRNSTGNRDWLRKTDEMPLGEVFLGK